MRVLVATFMMTFLIAGQVIAGPISDMQYLCRANDLEISPSGKYLFSRNEVGTVTLLPTDCLRQGSEAQSCKTETPIHGLSLLRGAVFADDDNSIYYLTSKVGQDGRPIGEAFYEKLHIGNGSVEEVTSNTSSPIYVDDKMLPYLTIYPGKIQGEINDEFMKKVQLAMSEVSALHVGLYFYPSQDEWGFISNDRFFLIRSDINYNIYVRSNGNPERFIGSDGSSYGRVGGLFDLSGARDLPQFKALGDITYVSVSGSVIQFDDRGNFKNISENLPRVRLINGENPMKYYGYLSFNQIYYKGKNKIIGRNISAFYKEHPGIPITGLSINEKLGTYVVTVKQNLGNGNYTHYYFSGEKTYKIACEAPANFTYKQHNIGGKHGIWIDSYKLKNTDAKYIYVHGGPQDTLDVDEVASVSSMSNFFLPTHGVDVVHYGGTRFTYALSKRLREDGVASLKKDGRLLVQYLRQTGQEGRANILFASFGGEVFRYLPKSMDSSFRRIALNVPQGSYPRIDKPGEMSFYRNMYGKDLYDSHFHIKDYELDTPCPLKENTLLIIGQNDTNVNAKYDYRSCLIKSNAQVILDMGGHGNKVNERIIFTDRLSSIAKFFDDVPDVSLIGRDASAVDRTSLLH